MKTYQVRLPLRHNGVRYEVDSTVALSDSEAKRLVDKGVVAIGEQHHNKQEAFDVPVEILAAAFRDEELVEKPTVKDALKTLKTQYPNGIESACATVMIEVKEYKVNAELRDEAWHIYTATESE